MAQPQPLDMNEIKRRMHGALSTLKTEFAGLRTGRASASLLDPITVEAYGQQMAINAVGTVNVPEPRMITVTVWDKGTVQAVDKAIRNAGIGLNPQVDGTLIRIPIPPLNEERRKELAKLAGKYAETARVAVRNVRRDGMDHLKKLEKEHVISEDQHKKQADEIQKATDAEIKEIDAALAAKEQEIMQV
jgi:ribosome recycling factor